MNSRSFWIWICLAAVLLGMIVFHHKHPRQAAKGPARLLPELRAGHVSSVQVRPARGAEIRVERSNETWRMTTPVSYPAEGERIERLIAALEVLAPVTSV